MGLLILNKYMIRENENMSTNMLIDGYVVKFDNFKKFNPKDDKQDFESCFLSINVANASKDANGKAVYSLVNLTGYNGVAKKLNEYEKGDRIICNADFNGVNVYESKGTVKATVRNILLFAPKENTSGNSNQSFDPSSQVNPPQTNAPQVNPPQVNPPQTNAPGNYNSSSGMDIDIPQVNNTGQRNRRR